MHNPRPAPHSRHKNGTSTCAILCCEAALLATTADAMKNPQPITKVLCIPSYNLHLPPSPLTASSSNPKTSCQAYGRTSLQTLSLGVSDSALRIYKNQPQRLSGLAFRRTSVEPLKLTLTFSNHACYIAEHYAELGQ